MRYSSALVLSTMAVGQAAAANLHNRHASFHARRQAEAKRSADQVDWNKVTYDLSDVDWSKVFASPSPSPTATATAVDSPVKVAEVKQTQSTEEPASTQAAATASAKTTDDTDLSDAIEDLVDGVESIVTDFVNGLEKLISGINAKVGKNPTSQSGDSTIWIGSDSNWKAVFTNDKDEDAVLFCWKSDNFNNMCIDSYQPEISAGLKSGESIELSFAEGTSSACAPVYSDTVLADFGGVKNTWWESTFVKSYGTFDVSRNVYMNGNSISSTGSKCKSDMDTCVYKCTSDGESCLDDYDLFNCDASNGGGGGYDTIMQGTGGGCAMGGDSETIQVVLS